MSRSTILLAAFIAGTAMGCASDATSPAQLQGEFALRAVLAASPPYAPVPVPAILAASAPGDTTRWLGGTFSLKEDSTWSERLDQDLIFAGDNLHPRALLAAGRYRVSRDARGRLVLDLYPDGPAPAVVSAIAVLSGDTLYHGAAIFVR